MNYIAKLVEYPGALQVREFAGGRACLVSARARAGAPAVGLEIRHLREQMPEVAVRIVAIYRRFPDEPDRFVPCDGTTRIEPGDEVFALAGMQRVRQVLAALRLRAGQPPRVVKRIMMAGGGVVSERLARALAAEQGRFHIKIVEPGAERSVALASTCPRRCWCCRARPRTRSCWPRRA